MCFLLNLLTKVFFSNFVSLNSNHSNVIRSCHDYKQYMYLYLCICTGIIMLITSELLCHKLKFTLNNPFCLQSNQNKNCCNFEGIILRSNGIAQLCLWGFEYTIGTQWKTAVCYTLSMVRNLGTSIPQYLPHKF